MGQPFTMEEMDDLERNLSGANLKTVFTVILTIVGLVIVFSYSI
jgi:hypothetical protein